MVLCGAMFEEDALKDLEAAGVKDSKLLSPKKRESLAGIISKKASKVEIIEFTPAEIDEHRLVKNINLNELEAKAFAQIIDRLKPTLAYIDSPDPNPKLFEERLQRHLKTRPKLVVENFADRKYVVVAAASILAKVRRDQRVAELRSRHGEIGSGYPADPLTIAFLEDWVRKHGELPDFARKSWETARRIESQIKQKRIC
jgi:ribonuclease HII